MHWLENIDNNLIPEMTDRVRPICPELVHIEVIPSSQSLRVVTSNKLDSDLRRAIESEVDSIGRSNYKDVTSWPVFFSRPDSLPYTHHLELMSPAYCPNISSQGILCFDVTMEQLEGMRRGEAEVVDSAAACDYVATFALGGVSILSRVSQNAWSIVDPYNPFGHRANISRFAERFHLLPALNRPNQTFGPDYLRNWLASRRPNSKVLIFDTGHDGGGVRAAANIILGAIRTGLPIGPSIIKVLGIVDRVLPDMQVEFDQRFFSPQGRFVRLSVAYKHVPKVITEDCNSLLGYMRAKDRTAILPVRRVGLFSLVNRAKSTVRVIGTSNTVNVYDSLMNDVEDRQRIWKPQPREVTVRVATNS